MILIVLLLLQGILEGVNIPQPPPPQNPWDGLRHQVKNQEIEMRCFEHKLENLQTILETLREQMQQVIATHQDQLKGSTHSLEALFKGLATDIQQLKIHANETTAILQAYEKRFSLQNQNIENLSAALQTVLDGVQVNNTEEKLYKIKSGDRLDKIAKAYGTTVKDLMRINQLSSDKIVEGKTLKLSD